MNNIRTVKPEDSKQIAEIYNYYIKNTIITFEVTPVRASEMKKRIVEVIDEYPWFVFEDNEKILGYAYLSRYKSRCAYKNSVEISIYLRNGHENKGIGTALLNQLFSEVAGSDIHAIIAGIALPNEASIKLHEKFGFEKVAHFKEIGFKFGKWIDVGYWEKIV